MSRTENKPSFIDSLLNMQPNQNAVEVELEQIDVIDSTNNDASFLVINSIARINGDIISSGDVLIDGEVNGSISARNLKVTKSGRVIGTVNVRTAIIAGSTEPEIYCQERLTVNETGKVTGKVVAKELVIFAGAKLLGVVEESLTSTKEVKRLSSIIAS